jgi:DNA-binding LacI/PurR family transcriptional regulator
MGATSDSLANFLSLTKLLNFVLRTVPQRVSLVSQTAILLRSALESGVWGKQLPSEFALCNELQISRVTLRAALEQLKHEGWFTSGRGRRRVLLARKTIKIAPVSKTAVALLSPIPRHDMPAGVVLQLVALRECLESVGLELNVVASSAAYSQHPDRVLEALHREHRPACYILYLSTGAMQRWFLERKINCLITGSCHPNVELPSIDIDYAAVCHHAVGRFVAAGKSRLALLMPHSDQAGNMESGRGFLDAGSQFAHRNINTFVANHDGTVESICRTIDRTLNGTMPCDGMLVAKPAYVITTMCHLLRRGVRVPDEVSVISRDADRALDNLVPAVACYQTDPAKFARKVARIVIDTISNGPRPHLVKRMMPTFNSGRTLR